MKRAPSKEKLPKELEKSLKDGKASLNIMISTQVTISPQSQLFVAATTDRQSLIAIQTDSILYKNLALAAANGIAPAEAGVPFRLLIVSFTKSTITLNRLQIAAQALPHPSIKVPSHLIFGRAIGITEEVSLEYGPAPQATEHQSPRLTG